MPTCACAGTWRGALCWQLIADSRAIGWIVAYAMGRVLMEEFIFRVLMLPHPKVDGPYPGIFPFARAAFVPLLFSVMSHIWTTQRSPKAVAQDAPFLLLVAGATTLAMMAYHTSQGSFLAACMVHMLLVLPWLIAGGGYKKLHTPPTLKRNLEPAPVAEKVD